MNGDATEGRFVCRSCNLRFARGFDLAAHVRGVHAQPLDYEILTQKGAQRASKHCDICKVTFTSGVAAGLHRYWKHEGGREAKPVVPRPEKVEKPPVPPAAIKAAWIRIPRDPRACLRIANRIEVVFEYHQRRLYAAVEESQLTLFVDFPEVVSQPSRIRSMVPSHELDFWDSLSSHLRDMALVRAREQATEEAGMKQVIALKTPRMVEI